MKGTNSAQPPCSFSTRIGFLIRINCLAASCRFRPADCNKNTKCDELPSIIGTSSEVMSIKILSIPIPAIADIKCSIVAILWISSFSWLTMVVHRVVSPTICGATLNSITGSRSTRRKTIPVFTGAGRKVMIDSCPVCSPMPRALMELTMVLWFKGNSYTYVYPDCRYRKKVFIR
ncbi:hypothetical protein THIOSC15_2620002 [uncultured Thiomicrorhabdus sp.]